MRILILSLCACALIIRFYSFWVSFIVTSKTISLRNVRFLSISQKNVDAKKEITVLDPKRSNAINIGLTVLPTARTIKGAILKMDSSVINKEGIEVSDSIAGGFDNHSDH